MRRQKTSPALHERIPGVCEHLRREGDARVRGAFSPVAALLAIAVLALAAGVLDPAPVVAAPWDPPRAFPARYDLRAHGRVSPVGRQDRFGTCWERDRKSVV